jgi:hypothetical protein
VHGERLPADACRKPVQHAAPGLLTWQ